jgi:TatD DNase family protein
VRRARWFDSHCHVQDAYRPDGTALSEVLAAAAAAGVEGLVCVGTDERSSRQALALARSTGPAGAPGAAEGSAPPGAPRTPRAWATVGLHPHQASEGVETVADLLDEALAVDDGSVVAVGECGLDYHYDHSPRPAQREAFAAQIALARARRLPLVVHTRQAWDDTIHLLRQGEADQMVVHCFSGGPDEARRCLDLGARLSFSGIVTFPNAGDVRAAAALCPLDRLMVETDAPFLAPVPHRGRPNQPAYVGLVGEAVAAVKAVAVEEVAVASTATARHLFGLS